MVAKLGLTWYNWGKLAEGTGDDPDRMVVRPSIHSFQNWVHHRVEIPSVGVKPAGGGRSKD